MDSVVETSIPFESYYYRLEKSPTDNSTRIVIVRRMVKKVQEVRNSSGAVIFRQVQLLKSDAVGNLCPLEEDDKNESGYLSSHELATIEPKPEKEDIEEVKNKTKVLYVIDEEEKFTSVKPSLVELSIDDPDAKDNLNKKNCEITEIKTVELLDLNQMEKVLEPNKNQEDEEEEEANEDEDEYCYSYYSCDRKQLEHFLADYFCYGKQEPNITMNITLPWKLLCTQIYPKETDALNSIEIKLFESLFEIISSEFTYIGNLSSLRKLSTKESLIESLSCYQKYILFGNVAEMHHASRRMFHNFLASFSESVYMEGIVIILFKYLSEGMDENTMDDYGHKTSQEKEVQNKKNADQCEDPCTQKPVKQYNLSTSYLSYLRAYNERIQLVNQLQTAEDAPKDVDFFELNKLMLTPMQRITRYPILLDNVHNSLLSVKSQPGFDQSTYWMNVDNAIWNAEMVIRSAKTLAIQCNQWIENNSTKNQHKMESILKQVSWNQKSLGYNLKSANRRVISQISVILFNNPCAKKCQGRRKCLLILFNDLLLLIQANSNKFLALNAAPWNLVKYEKCNAIIEDYPNAISPLTPTGLVTFISSDKLSHDFYKLSFISTRNCNIFSNYYQRFCSPNRFSYI